MRAGRYCPPGYCLFVTCTPEPRTLRTLSGLALCLVLAHSGRSGAQSESYRFDGSHFGRYEVLALYDAVQRSMTLDRSIPSVLVRKNPWQMPRYDRLAHYAGTGKNSDGERTIIIWINAAQRQGDDADHARQQATILAVCDAGFAGSKFKSIYDTEALRDAKLPVFTSDPFLHRHRFAAVAAAWLNNLPPEE